MDNFFTPTLHSNNYSRTYSKGKSFKFSEWNAKDVYNDDEFIQDFVKYDNKLWACNIDKSNHNPPSEKNPQWILVLDGVADLNFQVPIDNPNKIQWKYGQNNDEWNDLIEFDIISKNSIRKMLEDLEMQSGTVYDSELSETSANAVQNKVITEELGKKVNKTNMATINGKSLTEGGNIVIEGGGTSATPDWNASEGKAGHIKGRSHYIDGAISIPFEHWDKRFDEDGNAIYFHTIPPDNYFGCLIREGGWQEENYVFFGTEWKSLYSAVSADIRINYDSDSGDSVLEIILYRDADPESFLANFINNALFAYGQGEDFIYPIAKEFIPNTIARQESVDELREETTALWENLDSGTFPDLTAGDLAGRGESVPAEFGFRASGGKSIKDGRAYIKRIKGNSVVWNQKASFYILVDSLGIAEIANIEGGKMITLTQDYTGSADYDIRMAYNGQLIAGHTYCVSMETYSSKGGRVNMDYGGSITNRADIPANTWSLVATIGVAALNKANFNIYPNFKSIGYLAGDTFGVRNVRVTDLTQMFQAGNEPSTIEDFNARVATLGVDMNAYNEGQAIHCNTESIKSVGDNAWDEQWENGTFDITSGEDIDGSWVMGQIRSENPLPVLPNEEYYVSMGKGSMWVIFLDKEGNAIESPAHNGLTAGNAINVGNGRTFKTPTNAAFLKFYCTEDYGSTYNHDICIRLAHTGYKTDYKPYWEDTLPLPIIRKYFPQGMKKAGSAHDEIRYNKASGKWEYSKGRIKEVDLGTLNWKNLDAINGLFYITSQEVDALNMLKYTNVSAPTNLMSSLYRSAPTFDIDNLDKVFRGPFTTAFSGYLTVKDTVYTDAATFKAAMAGVMLYYESNDWEWEELDAEDQNFRDYYNVADFGTEMSHSNVPSAAFSADIIYQFNAVDMIREHEMEINELQSVIATMQAQLTSLINK